MDLDNYESYGIFPIMGNAIFISSTVAPKTREARLMLEMGAGKRSQLQKADHGRKNAELVRHLY